MRIVGGVMAPGSTKNVDIMREPSALFEEGLHLVEEAVAVLFHRHAALFAKFFEQFFLTRGQFGWSLNLDDKQLVAGTLALEAGMPRPLMRRVLSCCVPAGILMTVLPFSVGTSILPPSTAVTK